MIIPYTEEKPKVIQIGLFVNKSLNYGAKELLLQIQVVDFRPNAHKPANCYNCSSNFIVPLEILDLSPEILFWSCMKCGFKSLKVDFEHISKLIEESRDLYVVPEHFNKNTHIQA